MKLGSYMPLFIISRQWDTISINFVRRFPLLKHGHDYLFIVVDQFGKLCILMPSKKTMKGHEQLCSFYQICGFILVFPIVSNKESRFAYYRKHHGKRWNQVEALTMLHSWADCQTKVINITLVQFLWGYIRSYMWSCDEQVLYIQHSYKWALHVST